MVCSVGRADDREIGMRAPSKENVMGRGPGMQPVLVLPAPWAGPPRVSEAPLNWPPSIRPWGPRGGGVPGQPISAPHPSDPNRGRSPARRGPPLSLAQGATCISSVTEGWQRTVIQRARRPARSNQSCTSRGGRWDPPAVPQALDPPGDGPGRPPRRGEWRPGLMAIRHAPGQAGRAGDRITLDGRASSAHPSGCDGALLSDEVSLQFGGPTAGSVSAGKYDICKSFIVRRS